MANRMVKECDVFKTAGNVRTFEIVVKEVGSVGTAIRFEQVLDLSNKGVDRLHNFIRRGTTPTPGTMAKLSKDDPENFHANVNADVEDDTNADVEDDTPAFV